MALDRAQRELERLEGERALAESTRDHAGRQQAASLALLAEPLAGIADRGEADRAEADSAEANWAEADWAKALAADPARFATGLACRCTAFQQDRERLAGLERRQETLAGETRTKAVEVEAAASRTREADALKNQLSERRQAVAKRRAALFEGRPVTAVRAALERAQTAAADALDRARRTQEAARSAAAAAARELETRRHLAEERQAAAQAADATLAQALATAGVELAELRRRLAHDGAWQTREAAGLRALEQAAADDDIRRDERRRLVDAHQTNPPALTADEAAPRLQAAETALTAAQEQRSERLVRLRDDDSRRAQASALAGRLEQQRRTQELWEDLARLIGSADGKKFRTFAQQVSLDLLLAHANHHLGQLARRYRLEQICDGSLELQVIDRDLADDMRSVHSLSGGETFLVSLALALGLSSMTGGAAIGTLFIDEGFGALDPDSLDQAVACLETLQASGRQVGVVSHIPALVERIGVQVRVSTEGGGRSQVRTVRTGWAGVEETG